MFHVPPYYCNVSQKLSQVFDEIGVSMRMILKKRRAISLEENMRTTSNRLRGINQSNYLLGSQAEGTTTQGLESDKDIIICMNKNNVIQDWDEWIPGVLNLLMIEDDTTPPGYCHLQLLCDDAPLPCPFEVGNGNVSDIHGRILHKNTLHGITLPEGEQRQGPSFVKPGQLGISPMDRVPAYRCKSWPQSAKKWLEHQSQDIWPSEDIKRDLSNCKCLVVPVGSKVSQSAEFEWRISTSLAERSLMLSLNLTQITCFILMKMILKTYINPHFADCISSYICKTVLLHCIQSTNSRIWQKHNLMMCLSKCLLMLYQCISSRTCPHFIIHENNLLAGKISHDNKKHLLEMLSNFIQSIGTTLNGIQIDDLGQRLQIKLSVIPDISSDIASVHDNTLIVAATSLKNTALTLSDIQKVNIQQVCRYSLSMAVENLLSILSNLTSYYRDGNTSVNAACKVLAPFYSTFLGSMKASYDLKHGKTISPHALACMSAGINSDVSSSRLKLASLFYRTQDMDSAATTLQEIEEIYDPDRVEPACCCYNFSATSIKEGFCKMSYDYNEDAIRSSIAFCVRFSRREIQCVPHELQFEMFRSTQEEVVQRSKQEYWMDWAVVDSLPYLYFLMYKVYGFLQRPNDQQQSLENLTEVIETECNLGHRETALNLLGQCMEQENRPNEALHCYIKSLKVRPRQNAAGIHICQLLAGAI